MSPLLPETLHVFCGPDGAHAVRRRGWRQLPGEARCHSGVAAAAVEPWRRAIDGFTMALSGNRRCGLRVVLSNHLVQYRLIEWRPGIESADEYQALARLQFSAAFGSLADEWTVALSEEPPGVPRVAAAVPTGLLAGLDAAAKEAGCRLRSVQPYLTVAINGWRPRLAGDEGRWLLLHEPGRLCLALLRKGRWRWLRHVRVNEDWRECLPGLLEEEELLAGAEDTEATVLPFAQAAWME